jgi:hypothetical protein
MHTIATDVHMVKCHCGHQGDVPEAQEMGDSAGDLGLLERIECKKGWGVVAGKRVLPISLEHRHGCL